MKTMTLRLAAVLLSTLVVACGARDADTTSRNAAVQRGVFLDSPVQGLDYRSTTQSGVTDAAGAFTYLNGETVTFRLGSLVLGSALGQAVVTPLTLVPGANGDVTDDRVTNIAVLLQSLDIDGNPDNGITLPVAALTAAVQDNAIDLDLPAQEFFQSAELRSLVRQASNDDGREPVPPEQAQAHLQESVDEQEGDAGGDDGDGDGGNDPGPDPDPDPVVTLDSITVSAPANTLTVGATQQYVASGRFSDGSTQALSGVTWSSSVATVASITPSGLASALAAGVTTISATKDGKTGAAPLTVALPPPPPLPFKVGTGEADHNPKSRVCIGGGSTNCGRAAGPDDIRDPLIARAAAITGGNGDTFIVVTTTNIGYFLAYKPEVSGLNGIYDVRLRIAQLTGVPSTNITVVSDHSHNGPDTIGIWGGVSAEYMKITADAVVAAAVEAFESRRDAIIKVAAVNQNDSRTSGVRELDSSYDLAPGNDLARGNPYNEFRLLTADAVEDGERILSFVNYAPHATVTNGDEFGPDVYKLTGDWAAWVHEEANKVFGAGMGIGIVGALGATDWNKTGDIAGKEAEARARLRALMQAAAPMLQPVTGNTVRVQSTFIREAMAQPILLLNYKPAADRNDPAVPSDGVDVRIDRSVTPPFLTGTVVGTYVSAVRIGDVFLSTFPGEPFGELNHALNNEGRIAGARAQFLLGGANDFFGYMVKNLDTYEQTLRTGFHYLPGCEDQTNELEVTLGIREEGEGACADHWTLMVSPTIGSHIVCTLQNAADALGFTTANRDTECEVLTALDGLAAPPESDSPILGPVLDGRNAAVQQARELADQCMGMGASAELCMALEEGARQAEIYLGAEPGPGGVEPPANAARAGVASKDASWNLGASAGQFAGTGVGIARGAGFDPYGHSTRKVGSDILGTRIHTRALVVEGGNGKRVAIVANDLYLPNDLLHRRTAQLIAEHDLLARASGGVVTGITEASLSISSSHSHTSPFYSTPGWGTWIFQDVMDLRFFEYMARQQADAVIEAASNLKPVRMGGATVKSNDIQAHTYGPKFVRDGTPGGQPYDYTTQQVTVVSFDDISGATPKPLANWVIFGVHPEWVWGEEIVNGDVTHATMRMLDRETGAMTVMSQRETGSSGPHKDTRVHPPTARREFQESGPSGADRGARLLTDAIHRALGQLANNTPERPDQFAPYRSRFDVDFASQRFAPPVTRPYPGVSNCNTDRAIEDGEVGTPVVPGLPDCSYDVSDGIEPVREPFWDATAPAREPIVAALTAAGVPIPTSYSATSLTGVQETAAVHLQVFKLGGIAATMSPNEQFTSQVLNLESRLDKVPGNLWHGFDWACELERAHPARAGEPLNVTAHCERQVARYGKHTDVRGSFGNADAVARARAQVHNDASGWELDPVWAFNNEDSSGIETLGHEYEPLDVAQIKGNFTHEEFTNKGYDLVVSVGMVNDYWGYMAEYREYRSHSDGYRKALNALGPHGADFVATRLSRMAANLNGAGVAVPFNPLDPVYQAESARAEALARGMGEAARAYTTLYDTTVPADGGDADITVQPEMFVPRFSAAVMKFIGGSNYSGAPDVRVERLVSTNPDVWQTYGTQDGEVQLQLKFLPSLFSGPAVEVPEVGEGAGAGVPNPVALATWRAGMFEWEWTATFEAFVSELPDLGARPHATPEGKYRFVVDGLKREIGGALEPYNLVSATFKVVPWNGITVEGLRVDPDRKVSFALGPVGEYRRFRKEMKTDSDFVDIPESESPYVVGPIDYPDSYSGGISWITNERQLIRYGSGDRALHQQYCVRCTFRPWADSAEVTSAKVTVRNGESVRKLAATRQGQRWVTSAAIAEGETVSIEAGDIVDQYGEINGEAYTAAANRAPIADAGSDISVAKSGGVTLNGLATREPDRDSFTYAWTQVSGAAVTLTNASTVRPSFIAPDAAGVLTFRLTVTDSLGASHFDDVAVTVTDGSGPPPVEPFNLCVPVGCLRDIPEIGDALADALGALLGEGGGVPEPPAAGDGLPNTSALPATPLMPAEEASCAPDNSGTFTQYIGSLHEHSGYSDGTVGKTPADYFAQGKAQGLSFMSSTEHSDNALLPVTANTDCGGPMLPSCVTPLPSQANPAAPVSKWDMTLQQARAATDASFTAFRGFEWTSDRFGHINVYFSRNDFNAKTTEGYGVSMESFYNWFKTLPAAGGGSDGLLVFNHPGREEDIHSNSPVGDPAYTFNNFQYRADVDLRAVGIEVFGKGGETYDLLGVPPTGGWYAHALDQGWHLGPVGAEDEHGTNWGKPQFAKTVLLARDRSEGALREAMLARRFYAVAQNKNALRLSYTVGGQPMGSRLNRAAGSTVAVVASLTVGTGVLELVTNGGETVPCPQVLNAISCSIPVPAASEGERWYYVRAKQNNAPVAYTAPVWIRSSGAYPTCGEWLAGDLHVHSTYSHDSYGGPDEVAGPLNETLPVTRDFIPGDSNTGPEEFYVYGHSVKNQFRIAALRGLDYLAISDHNDIRSHSDPGRGEMGLIHLPSYENSLDGHAQMHGARDVYEGTVHQQAAALRADGGVFQINHPADANANPYPDNLGWSYGFDVVPDTIEVWNIGVRAYQAPFPSYTNNDASTQFWEDFLNRGHRVAATGGSDNHWVTLTGVAGAGQPTTWVFAKERSARGLLAGLREGRTFISHQPPLMGGPRVWIEADGDGDGVFESAQGDSVSSEDALRVRVQGAPGALVRLYHGTGALSGSGFVESAMPVMELNTSVPFTLPTAARTWLRAEVLEPDGIEVRSAATPLCEAMGGFNEDAGTTYCRNRLAVLAMTSALYLAQP